MVICHPVVNGDYIVYDDFITGNEVKMVNDDEWSSRIKGLLKAELKRRNIGYRELAEKLATLGISETERNLANKISRGGFTAVFFVQCLLAIGCTSLRLEEV
jgi:hypothetical protein